jgi:hypothetical protein
MLKSAEIKQVAGTKDTPSCRTRNDGQQVMIPGPQNRQTSVSSLRARVFRMTVRSK